MPHAADPAADALALLEPGERLLWAGRPDYRHFRSEAYAAFALGLVIVTPVACSAWLMLFLLVRSAFVQGLWWNLLGSPVVLAPAVGFSWVAVAALRSPWTAPARLARALYAVTDRRVIVRDGPGYGRTDMVPATREALYTFGPADVQRRSTRRRHGGRIDIVLHTEVHSGGRGGRRYIDVGILGTADPAAAEAALARLLAVHTP